MTEEERFVIDSASKADWALKKIQKAKRQQKENEKRVVEMNKEPQEEIEENNKWLEEENSKLDESIKYFESLLDEFMNNNLAENPKFKFKSPYGRISVLHSKKWSYDDDKLINRYKDTDLVKTEYKLNKKDLKKSIEIVNGKPISKDTGEIVDGITITEEEKINIKAEG